MLEFHQKELIIFDLDGTLINSIPDLTSAANKMLTHYNLKNLKDEEISPFIGNGAKALVDRSLKHSKGIEDLPEDLSKEALEVYFKAYEENPSEKTYLYPGVMKTLAYLKGKKYTMAICTNKPYRFIEPILSDLDIIQFFSEWIGEDSLDEKKPDPEPLLHLCKHFDIPKEKAIMIGDSKNDILAAQNAKIDSIGVSYGYNYNEDIREYNPNLVVDKFSNLKKYL